MVDARPDALVFHPIERPQAPLRWPIVMAHFLPWHTMEGRAFPLPAEEARRLDWVPPIEDLRHWHDSRSGYARAHLRMPDPGIYDSRDPAVIDRQIETAIAHGIDGFLINWYGVYSVENVITLHWLNGLARWNAAHPDQPFRYFLCHDMQAQWPTEGKRPVSLEEDFVFIRRHLLRPGYLCRAGRPLFAVFPYGDARKAYLRVLEKVFPDTGADLIACAPGPGCGEAGAFVWVEPDPQTQLPEDPYVWSDPDSAGTEHLREFYAQPVASGETRAYLMGGVWPGFNDQLVRWAWSDAALHPRLRPRVICRHTTKGSTLERTWDVYLEHLSKQNHQRTPPHLPAPLLQLITWNDYAEDTALEPTKEDGAAPLRLCREKIAQARRLLAGF